MTLSLIAEFQRQGHECALALRRSRGEFLDEARALCEVHELAPHGLWQFVPSLRRVVEEWKPTHVVTAFADIGVLTWLAIRNVQPRPRWVHGVHNTHSSISAKVGLIGRMRHWLDNRCAAFDYRRADAVIAVSQGVRAEIVEDFHVAPARVTTIYNPVVSPTQLVPVAEPRHNPAEPYTIVALGRLVRQKGFDVLIDAMTRVPRLWRLDIWGEGPDRPMLEAMIAERGLQGDVHLRGYTDDPLAVLRRADLFVLSSRHEGLPTALIEAMACQCQIVAADCPHGPREILLDGALGRLVPAGDPQSLAIAIIAERTARSTAPTELLARARLFSTQRSAASWADWLGQVGGG